MQPAGGELVDEALHVASPQRGVDHVGPLAQQHGNLRAELAGEQLGKLLGDDLHLRLDRRHGQVEVPPGILTPGVVGVDGSHGVHVGEPAIDIVGGRHAVGDGRGNGAENVLVIPVLEQPGGSADGNHGQRFQLVGHRRDRQAVPAGDVADHRVHLVALDKVAEFGDLLGRSAALVDVLGLDGGAGHALGVVGSGKGAPVDGVDHDLHAIAGRNAEGSGRGTGQEQGDAKLDGFALGHHGGSAECEHHCRQDG